MDQLSFAPGNKLPEHPDHPMFTAYTTKYFRGQPVKQPLGSIKKRLQKASLKAGEHIYWLDHAKA